MGRGFDLITSKEADDAVPSERRAIHLADGTIIEYPEERPAKITLPNGTTVDLPKEADELSQAPSQKRVHIREPKDQKARKSNELVTDHKISDRITVRILAGTPTVLSKFWHEFGWRFSAHLAASMAKTFLTKIFVVVGIFSIS